jgi:hypothetical protein
MGTPAMLLQRFVYFILGLCAISVVGIVLLNEGRPSSRINTPQRLSHLSAGTPEQLKFRRIAIFDGKTEEGVGFANYVYKSSDCFSVTEVTTLFHSSSRASEEVIREAEKASNVIERGPKFDEQGQQVGERVVMELKADDQNKESARIVWSYRSDFHSIIGPSLRHVIEFEKSLQLRNSERTLQAFDIQSVIFNPSKTSTGQTEAGVAYSEQQFETSDCETIRTHIMYFPSADHAEDELKKQLVQATNVVEQGPKVNASGEQVGERAVAMLRAERNDPLDKTIIAWTEGSEFHSIIGPNAQVLEFEKRHQQK